MRLKPIVVSTGWHMDEVETFGQAAYTPKPQGPAGATTSLDDASGMRTFRKLGVKLTMQVKPSQLTDKIRGRYAIPCMLHGFIREAKVAVRCSPASGYKKERHVLPPLLPHFRG